MIASSSSSSYSSGTFDLTDTTSTGTETETECWAPMDKEEEKEIQEDLHPKVDVFKAEQRNIVRQNKFSSKGKFRTHRTRNR